MKKRTAERIAVLSDGTCDTAETYVRAILAQFNRSEAEIIRIPRIRHEDELLNALDRFENPFLVAYTFATEKLRKKIWTETKRRGLLGVDILYPNIQIFSEFLHTTPTQEHGALHSTQAVNYFERMDAIEYTVKHDDGLRMNDLSEAEIILTGASRTSKTPTSMYLAHKGYRVANVPFVPGIEPPESLKKAQDSKIPIFLLTIEPANLEKIRRIRFHRLGTARNQNDTYVDIKKICEELEASHQLAKRHGWPIIDVTSKAVEETASEILLLVSSKDG